METVKFKWVHQTKWNTLKHLGKPFTDMNDAIRFVRHNKAEWGLQLKLGQLEWDNF